MIVSNIIAYVGGGLAAVFGTGGVGYAIVQAFIKRGDREVQANAAKILTGVASEMVRDLRVENAELKVENETLISEARNLRIAANSLLESIENVLPLLQANSDIMQELRDTVRLVKREIL